MRSRSLKVQGWPLVFVRKVIGGEGKSDKYYLVVSEDNHHLKGWVNRQYIVSYDEVLGNFGVDQD